MPTLVIDTISKRYERNRWALREFSLRMEAGVLGLVGPNGVPARPLCSRCWRPCYGPPKAI